MIWSSSDLRFKRFWVSIDVCLKWFWLSVELNFNWGGCQLIWDSSDLVVDRCVVVCCDLHFKWFGCQLIWDSSELVVNWCVIQMILVVSWCGSQRIWSSNYLEIQMSWLSTDVWFKWFWLWVDVRFKWFGFRMFWDSSELVVIWFEIQMIWLSIDLRFKAFLRDFLQKWSFEDQKTKLFCETSFKIGFEAQKRSFSTRLPSKMKLWRSKTKLFCETSFKIEALKLKNEAILRDFLQKWIFEDQKRSFFARLPSKMTYWPDTWPQNSNTF